jgi:hypothetical protein
MIRHVSTSERMNDEGKPLQRLAKHGVALVTQKLAACDQKDFEPTQRP